MDLSLMVKRAKRGDADAFVGIVKQYEGVLYKVARRLLNNDEDAADAMQDTVISAYKNINTLKNERYFNTWVCKILINKCNSILSKNKRVIPVEEVFLQSGGADEFRRVELKDALDSLNRDYKLVLVLYYIVGLNIREISEFIKEPEGTIKSRLSRAKSILRENYFNEEGEIGYGK